VGGRGRTNPALCAALSSRVAAPRAETVVRVETRNGGESEPTKPGCSECIERAGFDPERSWMIHRRQTVSAARAANVRAALVFATNRC